jgi:hypothetical protein
LPMPMSSSSPFRPMASSCVRPPPVGSFSILSYVDAVVRGCIAGTHAVSSRACVFVGHVLSDSIWYACILFLVDLFSPSPVALLPLSDVLKFSTVYPLPIIDGGAALLNRRKRMVVHTLQRRRGRGVFMRLSFIFLHCFSYVSTTACSSWRCCISTSSYAVPVLIFWESIYRFRK